MDENGALLLDKFIGAWSFGSGQHMGLAGIAAKGALHGRSLCSMAATFALAQEVCVLSKLRCGGTSVYVQTYTACVYTCINICIYTNLDVLLVYIFFGGEYPPKQKTYSSL